MGRMTEANRTRDPISGSVGWFSKSKLRLYYLAPLAEFSSALLEDENPATRDNPISILKSEHTTLKTQSFQTSNSNTTCHAPGSQAPGTRGCDVI